MHSLCNTFNMTIAVSAKQHLHAGMWRAYDLKTEAPVEQTHFMCERLVATALEATMIVVESELHGDPIPSLASHYRVIVEERERLYNHYQDVERPLIDEMVYEHGVEALSREYSGDSRNGEDELRRTFVEVLFHSASLIPAAFLF